MSSNAIGTLNNTESYKIHIPKRYQIDLKKLNELGTMEDKLNMWFMLIECINFTLEESVIRKDLMKFMKEV